MSMNSSAAIFNDSYNRCLARDEFIDKFYDRYITSNDLVAEKFAHTEMKKQKLMLEASLHIIMALKTSTPENAVKHFKRIGVAHGREQHDIPPALYDLWLESLIETVKEFDVKYDSDVDVAWRDILSDGIRIMKSMY